MESYDRDQSEFNDAANYVGRINSLLATADQASMELDANMWFHTLNSLKRELSTKMQETKERNEKHMARKFMLDCNSHLSNYANAAKRTGRNEIPFDFYMLLDEYEEFLREIYKKSGLEGKTFDDARKALK